MTAVLSRVRHFVSIAELDPGGLAHLLARSSALKAARQRR